MENEIIPFENRNIRRVWHNEQWYFSIVDVIEALTDSPSPKTYWAKLKEKEAKTNDQPFPFTERLKMIAQDGKSRLTECAPTEGVFRIIMSVPSAKAEPFKMWLAQVGRERLEETVNPELGFERLTEIYKAKGYPDEWIKQRLQTIEIRKQLTDEWQKRGVKESRDFSILTATIAKGTFGLTPSEHKKLKGLEKSNEELRDHMTPLELIFTALSEEVTKQLTIRDDAQGFNESHETAVKGGAEAGKARENLEKNTGLKVVSDESFLKQLKEKESDKGLPPSE
jgi:prophage antirepressor-like protein